MNETEIAERFILAAGIERKLPRSGTRPKGYGAYALPYVHNQADMNGWGYQPGDKLKPEDRERHAQHRREFWEGRANQPSAADITAWEECLRWTGEILTDTGQRKALWAWAFSKVGMGPFKAWCRDQGITDETGRRRKNRAISLIAYELGSKAFLHNELSASGVLAEGPETAYLEPTFENDARVKPDYSWRADPSLGPVFDDDLRDTSWADEQNRRRRARLERAEAEKDRAA